MLRSGFEWRNALQAFDRAMKIFVMIDCTKPAVPTARTTAVRKETTYSSTDGVNHDSAFFETVKTTAAVE